MNDTVCFAFFYMQGRSSCCELANEILSAITKQKCRLPDFVHCYKWKL